MTEPVGSRGMRWLYLLVLLGLAGVGTGAGDIVFVVHNLGHWGEVQACAAVNGLPPDGGEIAGLIGRRADYDRCSEDFQTIRLASRIGGAAGVIVLTGVMILVGGLLQQRKVRRQFRRGLPPEDKAGVITARFEDCCDRLDLRGRRRPRLVVLPPGGSDRDAYTTKVPFRRPAVVVPVEQAYDKITGKLDLVLLHELGHVRARDLTWASATWWAGLIVMPVLLLAMAPGLVSTFAVTTRYALSLPIAAALASATLLLRTAVLRRREHTADRFAAGYGPDARTALSEIATAAGEPPGWTPRRLFATHPPKAERFAALDRVGRWEGGFAVAFTVGLLAMFTFQTVRQVSVDLVANAVAATVWAGITVPLWSWRPAPGRRQWWARVLGSAAGLLAGYVLPPFGAIAPAYGFFLDGIVPGALAGGVVLLVGVSALGAGLAEAVAAAAGPVRRTVAAVLVVLELSLLFTALLHAADLVVSAHFFWRSVAIDRYMFGTPIGLFAAAAPPGLALTTALVVALGPRKRWRGPALVAVVAVGAAAPAIVWLTDHVIERGDAYYVLHSRWLLCAVTGWLVTMLFLAGRGRRGVTAAVLAGVLTTAASALLQVLWAIRSGPGPNWARFLADFEQRPAWLLTALLVGTVPLAILVHDVAAPFRTIGRRVALVAVPGVLAVTTVVALGWTAPVTGGPGDAARLARADVEPAGRAGSGAGRTLTDGEVKDALAAARRFLPVDWTDQKVPAGARTGVLPPSCADLFAAGLAADRARPVTASGGLALGLPATAMPPLGATMALSLTSYRTPEAARQVLEQTRAELAGCPRWTEPAPFSDERLGHLWALQMPGPTDFPYENVRSRLTSSASVGGLPAVTGSARLVAAVGHNVVIAEIAYGRPFYASLETSQQLLLDQLVVTGAKLIIHALDP
ncbi:M48 family metalloprotease [Actinoplanes sp. HUAS TT8]|uniref:M48 family metalloprotease n=1 Tax=Actinoplanes sp. HUAS TT8 TaxID=3447453 RepID=UPI003F524D9A